MSNPLVSIVVPVYNGEKYLVECLDSIIAQNYPYIEVLIIDDCSNDNTKNIIEKYNFNNISHRIHFNKKRHGVSFNRNYGIRHSKGDCLMFLDADDVILPNAVSVMVELFKKHKCTIKCQYFLKYMKKTFPISSSLEGIVDWKKMFRNFLVDQDKCFSCLFLFSRDFLVSKNIIFDENDVFMEELDFAYQLSTFEKKIFIIDLPLYGYRQIVSSASHSMPAMKKIEAINKKYEKYSDYFSDNLEYRLFAKNIVQSYLKTIKYYVKAEMGQRSECRKNTLVNIEKIFANSGLTIGDFAFSMRLLYYLLRARIYIVIRILDKCRDFVLILFGRHYYE